MRRIPAPLPAVHYLVDGVGGHFPRATICNEEAIKRRPSTPPDHTMPIREEEPRMLGNRAKSNIGFAVMAVCLAILAAMLAAYRVMGGEAAAQRSPEEPNASAEAAYDDPEEPGGGIDWDYWTSVNPDVVGWIYVPGTSIDYPVVQAHADDPTYYLRHDVYRNPNIYGCPYLDADCESQGGLAAPNAVVFAHHMDDGTMFADFARFSDAGYLSEHREVYLYEPGATHVVRAQAAAVIPGWEEAKRTSFSDPADFEGYVSDRLAECAANVADPPDGRGITRMTTFVTCSYNRWSWNERTLVYAW